MPRLRDAESVAISSDGHTLAMGNGDTVEVLLPSGEVRRLSVPDSIDLWMSGDGNYLIGLMETGPGEIVRISDGAVVAQLTDAMTAAVSVGSTVATEGEQGIDIYFLGTTKKVVHLTRDELHLQITKASWLDSDTPWAEQSLIAFGGRGDRLLAYETGGVPQVWEVATGHLLAALPTSRGFVTGAWLTPDGRTVLSLYDDSTTRTWTVPDPPSDVVRRPARMPGDIPTWLQTPGTDLDLTQALVTMADRSWVRTWSTSTGRDVCTESDSAARTLCGLEQAATSTLTGVGIVEASPSPDGTRLAVLDRHGAVWMFGSGPGAATAEWHTKRVSGFDKESIFGPLRWSPDARRLLADQGQANVIDTTTGTLLTLKGGQASVTFDGFWLDGGASVGGYNESPQLTVHSASTGRLERVLPKGTADAVMSTAQGRWIAIPQDTTSDGDVELVDTVDGSIDQRYSGVTGVVSSLVLSPDGEYVAAGQEDGGIDVWERRSGALVMHTDATGLVSALAFDATDDLVEVAEDGTVRHVTCVACRPGKALLALAASRITAPLDDEQATRFAVTRSQRDG
jgi:WD40 repeat protein